LGTPLPERTKIREYRGSDGRAPVTGTEWEFEEARAHAEKEGAPPLLVFRNMSAAKISTTDTEARRHTQEQLGALDQFWQRHFQNRGLFLTAFTAYQHMEEFTNALETQLRKLLQDLAGNSAGRDYSAHWFDRPFRGLEPYEFEHARIFFGRDAAVQSAVNRLVENSESDTAFLLILGASGSGKSSRAGILPALAIPRSIKGVGGLAIQLFRPSEGPSDLFLTLAQRIVERRSGDWASRASYRRFYRRGSGSTFPGERCQPRRIAPADPRARRRHALRRQPTIGR
jgi:hypothetical protein